MKTGKELKINEYKSYNVAFGSVNNKHPKAVYINISAWADPQNKDETSYYRVIRDINKRVKQSIYFLFTDNDELDFNRDRTIVDLDIRESGIRYGKRSFMNCEVTLFLNHELLGPTEFMRDMLDNIIDTVIDTFEENKSFKFYKKKK